MDGSIALATVLLCGLPLRRYTECCWVTFKMEATDSSSNLVRIKPYTHPQNSMIHLSCIRTHREREALNLFASGPPSNAPDCIAITCCPGGSLLDVEVASYGVIVAVILTVPVALCCLHLAHLGHHGVRCGKKLMQWGSPVIIK